MLFDLARPALFALDPERAHRLTVKALSVSPRVGPQRAGPLAVEIAGLAFPNPVGMAAGFDKDAEVPDQLLGLGFGFAEVGSITPRPQQGNPSRAFSGWSKTAASSTVWDSTMAERRTR